MPRPRCRRRVINQPRNTKFFPECETPSDLDAVTLGLDELEAVRLADLEGLYHEEAGAQMGVSRPTFGRILQAAHKKIAQVLIEGKALHIEGGAIPIVPTSAGLCARCARNSAPEEHCPFCRKMKPSKAGHKK